ncbi:DUF222 domain-containing protein [Actinotalea ferrariae]|uniref:HNH endonuclease signature motif containing protein n=1 Tax=Actinotalea ferrariae TaxID=1386098 RepID=UPI001C8C0087|nr:HNH endonuclease signature motif containing protein [Actinotalea ferrariae]MBX9246398.1 DUF222 domain-containing protein [Actinotalea ferrariae]
MRDAGQAVEGVEALDDVLAELRRLASRLVAMPLADLDGPEAAAARQVLRVVGDQLQLASATLLATVEQDGRWAVGGADRTAAGWAARREGIAYGEATRQLRLGQAIGGLPVARAAIVSGDITRGHVDALAEVVTSEARRAALTGDAADRNEAFLVEQAKTLGVDQFRKVVKRWAIAVDEPTAEREHTDAVVKESLSFARRRDGVAFTGFLTHENGELLTTAVRAVAGVPGKDDVRSLEQRQAAALVGVARLVLDKGLSAKGAQIRPHLNVLVPYETFERLASRSAGADVAPASHDKALVPPAELMSGEPLPPSVLARIACDSEVTRIVFGPDSQVLDVGRAERTYTKQLRRGVLARDRHCQYPGCTAPPTLGEVHHIRWWDHGGDTSVGNGILVCWYHHGEVHKQNLQITRVPHGFQFARRDGRPLAPPGYGPASSSQSGATPHSHGVAASTRAATAPPSEQERRPAPEQRRVPARERRGGASATRRPGAPSDRGGGSPSEQEGGPPGERSDWPLEGEVEDLERSGWPLEGEVEDLILGAEDPNLGAA